VYAGRIPEPAERHRDQTHSSRIAGASRLTCPCPCLRTGALPCSDAVANACPAHRNKLKVRMPGVPTQICCTHKYEYRACDPRLHTRGRGAALTSSSPVNPHHHTRPTYGLLPDQCCPTNVTPSCTSAQQRALPRPRPRQLLELLQRSGKAVHSCAQPSTAVQGARPQPIKLCPDESGRDYSLAHGGGLVTDLERSGAASQLGDVSYPPCARFGRVAEESVRAT